MNSLYNSAISLTEKLLPLSAAFNAKMKLFVEGRKKVFQNLEHKISPNDEVIWFHAASLGEYEQAVPVIEGIKKNFPKYKILVTFFSPSGYENKKNNKLADIVTYLPLDTKENAIKFIELLQPKMVFFVKYEIWPNFLQILNNRKIPTFLISASFRSDQIYFKTYGKMMRNALKKFEHIFVQEENSLQLLKSIGIENASVSGDTRFDRVSKQLEMNNELDFISEFKNNQLCVVIGSSWPEDEALFVDFINHSEKIKWIIAPHTFKHVKELVQKLQKKTMLFSEMKNKNLKAAEVLIIDSIGYLTRIYSYADIAYVGGAAGKTGLHNILEPAAFGVPIVIGKNHQKFPEAQKLQDFGGLFSVASKHELDEIFTRLIEDENFRVHAAKHSTEFISMNKGATKTILYFIKPLFNKK